MVQHFYIYCKAKCLPTTALSSAARIASPKGPVARSVSSRNARLREGCRLLMRSRA